MYPVQRLDAVGGLHLPPSLLRHTAGHTTRPVIPLLAFSFMPTFRIDLAYLIGGWCAAALWGMIFYTASKVHF